MLRRGISILEVLFSIGVIAIGLLGVIAVLPVALRQVGQGQTADAASRVGANIMREFVSTIYVGNTGAAGRPSMTNTTLWRRSAANTTFFNTTRFTNVNFSRGFDGRWGAANTNDDNFLGTDDFLEGGFGDPPRSDGFPMDNVSYCIDPRFISRTDTTNTLVDLRDRSVFPTAQLADPTLMRMMRVSLPGSETFGLGVPFGNSLGCMGQLEADQFFVIDDDLAFDVPDEVEEPPRQVYLWSPGPDTFPGGAGDDDLNGILDDASEFGWPGTDDIPMTREFDGLYSWMATLVPKSYTPGEKEVDFTLSVVVFQGRDLDHESERVARITPANFLGVGIGGGDVVIESLPQATRSEAQADVDSLRPGHWVLLGATLGNGISGIPETTFRWYRVVNVGDAAEYVMANDRWEIDATLAGPDWPVSSIIQDTQVVMISSIVAVYERTIHIQQN
jgi:hypothetical protein